MLEAVGSVPVALLVTEAEAGGGVVTLPAAALAFEELALGGNLVAFGLSPVGAADLDLARVAPGGPLAISISKTFVDVGVQARTDFAAVGGGVLEAVGVHLTILAESGSVGALTFLAGRVGVVAGGVVVPAAEILGEAGSLVEDEAVGGAAALVSPLIPLA